jgi:mono/diheme cytochrome c family protein
MRYFLLLFVLAVLGVVSVCGLRGSHSRRPPIELFADMVRQNKVRPQTPSEFFPDERASRLIPAGTVPRGGPYVINGVELKMDGKPVYPYEDCPVNTGRITGTTNWAPVNPLPISRQLLERGQQRYQINCLPCHGPAGDGKGITGKYGMIGMANFHDQRLIDMCDGEIFNTITYGKPPAMLMGPYGANVTVEDRWAIVAYVRVLQRSQLAMPDDVIEEPYRSTFKK